MPPEFIYISSELAIAHAAAIISSFLHFPLPLNSTIYSLHAKHDTTILLFSTPKDNIISCLPSVLDGKLPFDAKKMLTYMITKGNYFLSICIGKI